MDAQVVAALIAAAVAIASAVLGVLNSRKLAPLQSDLEARKEMKVADHQAEVDERAAQERRIRDEVLRWTNPVLDAVDGLESRLGNILHDDLDLALHKHRAARPVDPDWAVSYDYVLPTTLYLFANYFAWIRLMQEKLSFELFESKQVEKRFFEAMWGVSKTLGDWWPGIIGGAGRDTQVFALQQRAIGEALIRRDTEDPRPMTIPEFLSAYNNKKEPSFNATLEPLRELVDGLERGTKRWARLSLTLNELWAFQKECRALLELRGTSADGSPAESSP
jgi:hypothetical protein